MVEHLQRDCVQVRGDEAGRIVRRWLHSRGCAEATWVVSAPAQGAVDVLERLLPAQILALWDRPLITETVVNGDLGPSS
ncbi:hypothetical protein ACIRVF_24820 [Kitasatospora sp. NPDC101157]|uniref:hypothetical protein n=1 Tax=Kitasatospora sp. NPDC101157 TaxID=3364098 RepID=UPI003821D776